MRGSHTKNPIEKGVFACLLALPWLYGTAEKPEGACTTLLCSLVDMFVLMVEYDVVMVIDQMLGGVLDSQIWHASVALMASSCACRVSLLLESTRGEFCKICYNTLKDSGLLALYKTVGKFVTAANAKHELMAEFLAARLELIAQVNSGHVPLRCRASKRGDPKLILKEAWR